MSDRHPMSSVEEQEHQAIPIPLTWLTGWLIPTYRWILRFRGFMLLVANLRMYDAIMNLIDQF